MLQRLRFAMQRAITRGLAGPARELHSVAMIKLLLWLVLLVLSWPIALLALVLWPLVWVLSLPFRLVGIAVGAVFAFLRALMMLPARALGGR